MSEKAGSAERPLKRSGRGFGRFVPVILALVLALGASTLFRACAPKEDGTWMHCHQAQEASVLLGVVLAVILLIQALLSSKAVRMALCVIALAGSLLTFFIPGTLISMCMMDTMRCQAVLKPFVRIMAVLIAISSVVELMQALKADTGRRA